ncbi:MAG: hypothetical protein HKP24_04095 [Croceitalea sp.]|nr:hypothetical protein [Croceitalea sp.]
MDATDRLKTFFEKEHPFKNQLALLRSLAKKTEAVEKVKWGMPVYCIDNKNVFGLAKFKSYCGIWFFNGAYMKDPNKVLENAQEGKTKAMRHWKFYSEDDIGESKVLNYLNEAIQCQKLGKVHSPVTSKKALVIPNELLTSLKQDAHLKKAFDAFSPYKQKEFCEYIQEAKQDKTKIKRLEKIVPMIKGGIGLNDGYR